MEACLSVFTCDKCGETMARGELVVIIAEGKIVANTEEMLTFHGLCIRYACHLDCWDGVESTGPDEF